MKLEFARNTILIGLAKQKIHIPARGTRLNCSFCAMMQSVELKQWNWLCFLACVTAITSLQMLSEDCAKLELDCPAEGLVDHQFSHAGVDGCGISCVITGVK